MIINWLKSLFHKQPNEIVKLKEVIEIQKQEKEQLQKDLETLLARKIPRPNKKTIAKYEDVYCSCHSRRDVELALKQRMMEIN